MNKSCRLIIIYATDQDYFIFRSSSLISSFLSFTFFLILNASFFFHLLFISFLFYHSSILCLIFSITSSPHLLFSISFVLFLLLCLSSILPYACLFSSTVFVCFFYLLFTSLSLLYSPTLRHSSITFPYSFFLRILYYIFLCILSYMKKIR